MSTLSLVQCCYRHQRAQFSSVIKKMCHIYTMEYYAAIKNDEFVSFVGTWMNLENIILSKLTQEQKMKYHMFSLIGRCWTMRRHRHGVGEHYTLGSVGGNSGGTEGGRELGKDSMGRNARHRWRGEGQQITLLCVYLCNYLACSSLAPQNLKGNKKIEKEKNKTNKQQKIIAIGNDRYINWFHYSNHFTICMYSVTSCCKPELYAMKHI